jgi:phage gp16-like protein
VTSPRDRAPAASLTPKQAALRARRIKLIHTAKRELGLDDDAYRDLLARETGQRSAKDLDLDQLGAVVEALRRAGFRAKPRGQALKEPQHRLIAALWGELHAAGAVADGSARALAAFVRRQTGIERLEWLPSAEAAKVAEALKAWRARSRR